MPMPSDFPQTPARCAGAESVSSAMKPKVGAETRAERWLEENREAIDGWNAWVEANGLPLAKYRLF